MSVKTSTNVAIITSKMDKAKFGGNNSSSSNSGSDEDDTAAAANGADAGERELELLRGDSPLTIDSNCIDHDGGDDEEDIENERSVFSPTTDEDKARKERKHYHERQRKLSSISPNEEGGSSEGSISSAAPSDDDERKQAVEKNASGTEAQALPAAQALPFYTEPDWTVSFCEGIPYKAYKGTYLYPMYSPEVMKPVEAFQARDDDIVLCSFMKTGTTWLQSIILAILHADKDPDILARAEAHQQSPCLERMEEAHAVDSRSGLQMISELPKNVPRFYQTHLPLRAMPASIAENKKLRMVYVTRNPKDTAVSWYYFMRHCRERYGDIVPHISVQQYGRQVMGQTPIVYGPFINHVNEFYAAQKQQDNILFVTYEQLQQRYVETVQEIAKFLGKDLSPEAVVRVAKSCRIDSLKSLEVNQRDSQICGLHTTSFFRKGQTGGWKEHFTVAFNEEMDQWLDTEASKTNLRFEFI